LAFDLRERLDDPVPIRRLVESDLHYEKSGMRLTLPPLNLGIIRLTP